MYRPRGGNDQRSIQEPNRRLSAVNVPHIRLDDRLDDVDEFLSALCSGLTLLFVLSRSVTDDAPGTGATNGRALQIEIRSDEIWHFHDQIIYRIDPREHLRVGQFLCGYLYQVCIDVVG